MRRFSPTRVRLNPNNLSLSIKAHGTFSPERLSTPRRFQMRSHSQLRMPAEWQKHNRTLTVWPDKISLDDPEILSAARVEVSAIANAIAQFEPVTMYTRPENVDEAKTTVSNNVTVVGLEVNELWVRDTGPLIVQNTDNEARAACLNFNYWGGKLPQRGDEDAARYIALNLKISGITAPFQAEGGGIDVDGEGTLLATESSIINSNRNPNKSKRDLEEALRETLGAKKVIWLPGLKGYDITDYHIDAFARFVRPGTVLLSRSPKEDQSAEFKAYAEAKLILETATDAQGRNLDVFEIAEPDLDQVSGAEDGEAVASYVNFLLVNGGVIVPRFGVSKADLAALEVFRKCFPDRNIVQVHINALPRLGGGIHCATQQIPAF